MKTNQAIECSVQINDAFYNVKTEDVKKTWDLYDLYRMEAALNFKRTTDFHTMKEHVPFIKFVSLRYNWQMKVKDLIHYSYNSKTNKLTYSNDGHMLIVINLN